MYKGKSLLRNKLNGIKYLVLISLTAYMTGVVFGTLYTDARGTEIFEYYSLENKEHIYRCVHYLFLMLFVSNSTLGIPVILYFLYIFGINSGAILNLFFSLSKSYEMKIHTALICVVLSVLSAIIIGSSAIKLSKEIFTNTFVKKNNKISKIFINSFILMVCGFTFYYFSVIFKVELLEYIK